MTSLFYTRLSSNERAQREEISLNRIDYRLMTLSLVVCVLITILKPSRFISDGMGRYVYGFPFTNITIYQWEPTSKWFATNFFSGNDGLLINPLSFILNALLFYLVMKFFLNKYKYRKSTT